MDAKIQSYKAITPKIYLEEAEIKEDKEELVIKCYRRNLGFIKTIHFSRVLK
jgi:hypothetical protein